MIFVSFSIKRSDKPIQSFNKQEINLGLYSGIPSFKETNTEVKFDINFSVDCYVLFEGTMFKEATPLEYKASFCRRIWFV